MAASVKREKRALRGERGKGAWGKEGKQSDIPGAGELQVEGAEGRVQADEKGYKEAQAGSRSRPAGQMI